MYTHITHTHTDLQYLKGSLIYLADFSVHCISTALKPFHHIVRVPVQHGLGGGGGGID